MTEQAQTHIAVQNVHYSCRTSGRIALGCEFEGARYHVWLDLHTMELSKATASEEPLLFKNPPLSVKHGDSSYFRTRALSVDSKRSAQIIAAMRETAAREGAMERFEAAEREEEESARAKRKAELAAQQIREAAPELYAALKAFVLHYPDGPDGVAKAVQDGLDDELLAARAALAKATQA